MVDLMHYYKLNETLILRKKNLLEQVLELNFGPLVRPTNFGTKFSSMGGPYVVISIGWPKYHNAYIGVFSIKNILVAMYRDFIEFRMHEILRHEFYHE